MKLELIFLWILQDEHGCFHEQGFNFSPLYKVWYDFKSRRITIQETNNVNIFNEDNILNLTALIGENGTGKTTLMQFINSLMGIPLEKVEDNNYKPYINLQNVTHTFIAVYMSANKPVIINKTKDNIFFNDNIITSISNEDFNSNDTIGKVTHIYFTNSEYAQDLNMFNSGIDHISIHNKSLNSVAKKFYASSVGNKENNLESFSPYYGLQKRLITNKTIQDFQQILDVLYLYRASTRNENKEYIGKQIHEVRLSFINAPWYIYKSKFSYADESTFNEQFKETLKKFNEILENNIQREYKLIDRLVINLAFEITFVYGVQLKSTLPDKLLSECKNFIYSQSDTAKTAYYRTAIKEVELIRNKFGHHKVHTNSLPKNDLAYQEWINVPVSKIGELLAGLKNYNCESFFLKYINIGGLELSSGERALLNLSSRIEMLDYLYQLEGTIQYKPKENILLLIDEIDLYVHPRAQCELISSLINQIKCIFEGHNVQIIVSSHSPIVLSDIPSKQTIYLKKNKDKQVTVDYNPERKTFAANIASLYKDSFFIDGGIGIGKYALTKLNEIANYLNNINIEIQSDLLNTYEKIISMIGETVLKSKMEKILKRAQNGVSYKKVGVKQRNQYLEFLYSQRDAINTEISRLEKIDD